MLTIAYKCHCMKEEVMLQIPPRESTEDIIVWMNLVVQPAIYLDHRKRSPTCKRNEMEYAKIHLPENAEFIGQDIKPN